MNILITGGAGYLGSVIGEVLTGTHQLFVIDDLSEGNSEAIPPDAVFIQGNYCNEELLETVFTKYEFDAVIHLAGTSGILHSVQDPDKFYINNIAGFITLLSVMKRHKVDKLLFASSAGIYGENDAPELDERFVAKPLNPYGACKSISEALIKDYSTAYGLMYIIFRIFTVAGATEMNGEYRSQETHLLPSVMDHLLGRKPVVSIFGNSYRTPDGTPIRDYVHISDVARAFVLGLEKIDMLRRAVINLGSGKGYSVLEIIKECERLLEKKIVTSIADRRPTEAAVLVSSKELAYRLLGWVPRHTIGEIIMSAYQWKKKPRYG